MARGVGVSGVLRRRNGGGQRGGEGGSEKACVWVYGRSESFQEEDWDRRGRHCGAISRILKVGRRDTGTEGSDVGRRSGW